MEEQILNKKECAAFLHVSERTIDEMRIRDGLPCFKSGGVVLFSKSHVFEWFTDNMKVKQTKQAEKIAQ